MSAQKKDAASNELSEAFRRRMYAAADDLLKTSGLIYQGRTIAGQVGYSHSRLNKVFIVHFEAQTELGFTTLHIWFDDVDEEAKTFKINPQVMFAGRSGKSDSGADSPALQLIWSHLGFTYRVR